MSSSCVVVFDPACETDPYPVVRHGASNLHTTLQELAGSVVRFDRDGAIHKSGLGGAIDFVSKDACGSVPLHLNGNDTPAFVALVHNGMLSAVISAQAHSGQHGFRFAPCWEMNLKSGESFTDAAIRHDGESMIELIKMIDIDRSVQMPRTINLMAGIALAEKERLQGLTTQQAWSELNELERQTVIHWFSSSP